MGAGDSVASDSDDVPPLEDLGYGGNDSWSMDQSQYLANYAISQVNRMNYAIAHPTTVVLRDVFLDVAALDADFMPSNPPDVDTEDDQDPDYDRVLDR
jgi:hypothetical protein